MDIKFLPTPPTDNLYKFMAIFGAWALLILAGFMMGIGYLGFKSRQEMQQTVAYYRTTGTIRDIQDRLAAIQAGRPKDAIVSWAPLHDGSDAEKAFLQNALKSNQAYLARHHDDLDRHDVWTFWQIFSATDGLFFILVLGGVGIFCFIFGFLRWRHIQHISNAILHGELAFQEMANQKLQLELEAMTPPPSQPPHPTPIPDTSPS